MVTEDEAGFAESARRVRGIADPHQRWQRDDRDPSASASAASATNLAPADGQQLTDTLAVMLRRSALSGSV